MLGAGRGPFCCLPQGPFGVAGLLNEGIGLTGCEAAVTLHLVSVKISNAYFNDCPRKIVLPPSSHSHLPVRDDAFVQLVPEEQGQWPPSAREGGPLGSRLNAVCQMRTSTHARTRQQRREVHAASREACHHPPLSATEQGMSKSRRAFADASRIFRVKSCFKN